MAKAKERDVIRWALLDAINWERSYLDSYTGVTGADEIRAASKARIAAYETLLKKKYGGVPTDPMANAVNVDIRDI
jgi:hypothetical protein